MDGKAIGEVTSGTFSPTLKKALGMAYLAKGNLKTGTPVQIKVRTKMHKAVVSKMPFVPAGYYKKE